MPYCTQCGHQNPDGSRYCARCGQPLDQPASEQTAAEAGNRSSPDATTSTIPAISGVEDTLTGELSDEESAAVRALPAGSALLIVRRGPNEGSRFLLQDDKVTIGRHPDSEIFLDDITVSRRHAVITRSPDGWTIADQGSLNGTYVRRTLTDGEVAIRTGDEVQVGKFRFTFFASSQS